MSEQEFSGSDIYSVDESDDSDDSHSDKKALPWHSMELELLNKEKTTSLDEKTSSNSSSLRRTNKKKICSDDKAVSKQSRSLDKLEISGNYQNTSSNSSPRPLKLENKKDTSLDNALPWENKIENVQMKDPPTDEINLLLLGESGVGKSTFINSFANYMKHENFEAVQDNNLSVLIPARFNIFDKEFHKHVIEIGANDENEHLADGAAATQDVKTYVFYITLENKSYLIRLIDTPGMGDPRGIDQDNKNCDYVLNYLGRLEKIHAICLLLKPTNTRLDVFLNYCITQILSRLEKSATENIAFLFTNTRGQNYTPGETYTSLELLVKKIKDTNNVSLPLSHKNVFCFDNEAFRFLASIKQGVEFREGILEANIESWKYSYKEVYRLMSYIVQLKPHDPKKTISINHARKMVLQLSQPLAEIVQLIGDNIYQLDQHTNQLLVENQTLEELKQKLYMPIIDIRVKELAQPVTVCTAPQCSTIYKVAEKNKFHYKQRCHNPCYLNNVPAEIVGDPNILKCTAMHGSQTCQECGCRFNTHMHIYYETDTFENKIVDQNVLQNITNKKDATKEKEHIINKILDHKVALEKEHKHIIKCSAAFAHFLQQNAITPTNDALKEYLKYLITREENLGHEADRSTLDYLRRLLTEYEQERKVLEEALKHNTATDAMLNCSPNLIESKIKDLFTLPNFGKKIKQLYDLHQTGGLREHKQSEHVVKERYTLSLVDKVKYKVKSFLGIGKSKEHNRLEVERQRSLEYQQQCYSRQLQRQERHPRMHSNLQFNGPYGNPYAFGPNAQIHFNELEPHYDPPTYFNQREALYCGWEENEHLLPPERPDLRQRYALKFDPRMQYYDEILDDLENAHEDADPKAVVQQKIKHFEKSFDDKENGPLDRQRKSKAEITRRPQNFRMIANNKKGPSTAETNAKRNELCDEDDSKTHSTDGGKKYTTDMSVAIKKDKKKKKNKKKNKKK